MPLSSFSSWSYILAEKKWMPLSQNLPKGTNIKHFFPSELTETNIVRWGPLLCYLVFLFYLNNCFYCRIFFAENWLLAFRPLWFWNGIINYVCMFIRPLQTLRENGTNPPLSKASCFARSARKCGKSVFPSRFPCFTWPSLNMNEWLQLVSTYLTRAVKGVRIQMTRMK